MASTSSVFGEEVEFLSCKTDYLDVVFKYFIDVVMLTEPKKRNAFFIQF